MFKTNSEIIKIEAKSQAEIKTGVTFWSHDRGTAKLIFKLIKDGVPQSIPEGTTVPIRLIFKSKTAQDGFGKHDYLATVEDRVNGIISIILEDNILGYIGEVKGSIYLDLPGDRSLDTAGRFNFSIQRSPIDDSTPELEDYYFNGFSQTIDKIEGMISQAENRIDGKVDQIESEIEVLEGKVDQAQGTFDRIEDDLKETGKLKKVYSNSIDFGDYDYSGNPNLMNNLSFSDFAVQAGGGTISDGGNFLKINKTSGTNLFVMAGYKNSAYYLTPVLPNTTYTITYTLRKSSNFVPQYGKRVILRYGLNQNVTTYNFGELILDSTSLTEEFTTYTKTFTTGTLVNPNSYYFQVLVEEGLSGEIELSYEIKLERGSVATPYQPNLLNEPYYLSNIPLGENIANKGIQFPIKTSEYLTYIARMIEPFVVGETYTITIKATKPASQTFMVYNSGVADTYYGNLKPVEGLTDVWSLTFTPSNVSSSNPNDLRIFQYPSSTVGACQIDWLKIEKGPVATPLIKEYKYQGLGQTRTSIDKYLWKPFEIKNEFYSNDINFGDYDYSGNPNLLPKINKSAFTLGTGGTVTDGDDNEVIFTLDGSGQLLKYDTRFKLPPLLNGETYTISCEIKFHSDVVGDLKNIKLVYNYLPGGATMIETDRPLTDPTLNKWIKLKGTRQVQYTANAPQQWYIVLLDFISANRITGTISLRNIKVEKGTTATPYQPNLLDAPYYLSKVALGENIANPTKTFPINTSAYLVYTGANTEPYIAGQKYTLTMKATKPATQTFNVFMDSGTIGVGSMTPVEGLTDVWQKTFTVSQDNINAGVTNRLAIYQVPNSSVGAIQIEWLKIEKGDTRTPNILCYKYRGVNNFVSKNLKDYIWDINNDYAQQIFDDTVSLTKPQTIISAKNFEEVPTVKNQPIHYGPQLFEGWYGSGEEHAGMGTKARLRVGGLVVDGRDQLSEPFTWNSGRYEATVNRDITFYCKGTMFVEMGGNIGKYIYIANWKNSEQTQYASGIAAGAGTNLDGGLYYRNMLDFSWVVQLKQGDKFSIGIELADGKTVSKIQIRTLHIKELVPPTN